MGVNINDVYSLMEVFSVDLKLGDIICLLLVDYCLVFID